MTLEEKIADFIGDIYIVGGLGEEERYTQKLLALLRTHYAEQGREPCTKPVEWKSPTYMKYADPDDEYAHGFNDGLREAKEIIINQIERV